MNTYYCRLSRVRDLIFSRFTPAEQPQHGHLQELLSAEASGPHAEEMRYLATLLEPWSAGGSYGELFDGVSNVNLTGEIAHFELGYIPESAEELKAAAAFLIANYTRSHMMRLPRALRKRNIFEEVARFSLVPSGKKVLRESYQQLRKYNVWNVATVQNYEQFKASDIRGAVFGNPGAVRAPGSAKCRGDQTARAVGSGTSPCPHHVGEQNRVDADGTGPDV